MLNSLPIENANGTQTEAICLCYTKPSCSVHPPGQILIASAPSLSVSVFIEKFLENPGTIPTKIPGIVLQMPDIQFSPSPPFRVSSQCSISAWMGAEFSRHRKRRHGRVWSNSCRICRPTPYKHQEGWFFCLCFELPLPFSTQECEKA